MQRFPHAPLDQLGPIGLLGPDAPLVIAGRRLTVAGWITYDDGVPPELEIDADVESDLRFMTADVLAAARVFPNDVMRPDPPPSTLVDPRIARYTAEGWNAW